MLYGIEAHRIVAYTYDAAVHCKDDTERKFGLEPGRNWVKESAIDSEGNSVHPVFTIEWEGNSVESCDDCGTIICMTCGFTDEDRQFGDSCWNCDTAWWSEFTGDDGQWPEIR
jgi:hypothetical protein